MLESIDHVGIAVVDIEASIGLYRDDLGLQLVHREVIAEQGVDAALFDVGESHVELIGTLTPNSGVARFLADRGPGLHHVAYRVKNIDVALAQLAATDMALIDKQPRTGIRGSRVAFLHPKATGGVLTEIVEPAAHS